jgi:hypothetical protein
MFPRKAQKRNHEVVAFSGTFQLSEEVPGVHGLFSSQSFWKRGPFRSESNIGSSRSAYCIDMHSRDTPSSPDCLSSTSSSSPHGPSPAAIFDDQEKAALAWAGVVTRFRGRTSQQTSAPVGFWNRGAAARFQRERHRVCLIHH